MGCMEENNRNDFERHERHNKHEDEGSCSRFFPDDIEELLRKLVCECVIITLKSGCKEKVRIECVSGDLLVAKEDGNLKFIDIDCICSVTASRETVLDAIISPFDCHD